MDTNPQDQEHEYEVYDFGWWPEIVGAIAVAALIWYLISFARGSL